MIRRIHCCELHPGTIALGAPEAHHLRDVLRLAEGARIELFDDAGATAEGTLVRCDAAGVLVAVERVAPPRRGSLACTVAAAVPKGDRADWMIEKLSELGISRFIPLATARSVVLPAGRNKLDRWRRIATEAARQSHRDGVMEIAPLTPLADALAQTASPGCFFSTAPGARPIREALPAHRGPDLTLWIGPEGGWTRDEMAQMEQSGLTAVALTPTILRVETAAVSAAAIAVCLLQGEFASSDRSDSAP